MTGEPVTAEQARAIGLVQEVVEDPRAAALALVESLRSGGPAGAATGQGAGVPAGRRRRLRAEREAWKRPWATADHREALAAFLGHRAPVFIGL